MAETTYVICPALAASKGPHCWHVRWVPVGIAGECTMHSAGQVCCWCGEPRPLQVEYAPAVQHGQHRPPDPTQQRAGFVTYYREPIFGHGGIPVETLPGKDVAP